MKLPKFTMPAGVTASGVMTTLKWVLLGILAWQVSGVARDWIKDQKQLRDGLVENTVGRRMAEQQNVQLQQVVTEQQAAQERQAAALEQAAAAIGAMNTNFNRYRSEQQKLQRSLQATVLAQQAATDPAGTAKAANALSDQLSHQFEDLYP